MAEENKMEEYSSENAGDGDALTAAEASQADSSPENEADQAPQGAPRCSCSCGGWMKLILVALLAAVIGAAVMANQHTIPVRLFFGAVNIKAGWALLSSAIVGFLLGVIFIWSALVRK